MDNQRSKMKYHSKQWFRRRVGLEIYREPSKTCDCSTCQKTKVKVCTGEDFEGNPKLPKYFHADYLYLMQCELGIKYFDKPFKSQIDKLVIKDKPKKKALKELLKERNII